MSPCTTELKTLSLFHPDRLHKYNPSSLVTDIPEMNDRVSVYECVTLKATVVYIIWTVIY